MANNQLRLSVNWLTSLKGFIDFVFALLHCYNLGQQLSLDNENV